MFGANVEGRALRHLIICFVDLMGYARDAERTDDTRLADILDRYYERIGACADRACGAVIKLIGDGALLAFPPTRADDAVRALLMLRADVAALMAAEAWASTLVVKVHAGDVVCGPFGPRGQKRIDIVGGQVNIAARLSTRSFGISAEAFRALSKEGRTLFKKHTLPIVYMPVDDPRPSAMSKR